MSDFIESCELVLQASWERVLVENIPTSDIPVELKAKIETIQHSSIKTYRYVLPTHLLAKVADKSLDCRSIQKTTSDSAKSFDARSLCHKVIVPFDRKINYPLGGSNEPYVNNPLRVPSVSLQYLANQKNKAHWTLLVEILDYVESGGADAQVILYYVLHILKKIISESKIDYQIPLRVSFSKTIKAISTYLAIKSGGERLQIVSTALFGTVGSRFGIYDKVESHSINTSDASSGQMADIECFKNQKLLLAVEVKDKEFSVEEIDASVTSKRSRGIGEIAFIIKFSGNSGFSHTEIDSLMERHHDAGQNVYISNLQDFLSAVLILLGEDGRKHFITEVGIQLDKLATSFENRKAWELLLKEI